MIAILVCAVLVVAAYGVFVLPYSFLCHCGGIGSVSLDVSGRGMPNVSQPTYPTCDQSDPVCFTYFPATQNCSFRITPNPAAIVVNATAAGGKADGGANVSLAASGATLWATPALWVTTSSAGQAVFKQVGGNISPHSGDVLSLDVSVSSTSNGVITTESSGIPVEPPPSLSC